MQLISHTRSICPVCGCQLPARRLLEKGNVYLQKSCPQHGEFTTLLWRGPVDYVAWQGGSLDYTEKTPCPEACGICSAHQQGSCCVLYEVTSRCDLRCRFCFADGGNGKDIPLEQAKADISKIAGLGNPLLQLSGGEPSLRDDLPELIAHARKAGCTYVQLNTNGLRLARDEAFLAACVKAGLSFVFLQFDGTREEIYQDLRGRGLLEEKKQAIAACAKYRLGVTLVPTLVPGVNTDNIGEMLRFAISQAPGVRGIHFQPVSYFGRYPQPPAEEDRYTLGDLLRDLEIQSRGLLSLKNIAPSHCDHPLCGFHGSFIAEEDGNLLPLTQPSSCSCRSSAEQNRSYIGTRWYRGPEPGPEAAEDELEAFLRKAKERAFTVTAMAFQDAWNLDLARLRRCSLHVYKGGRLRPFCANYLSLMEEA
ncbi:MAG: radical SAM protein [Bacillota bacterium]|nr:radical SAM protein [Bacillota bacterium]